MLPVDEKTLMWAYVKFMKKCRSVLVKLKTGKAKEKMQKIGSLDISRCLLSKDFRSFIICSGW